MSHITLNSLRAAPFNLDDTAIGWVTRTLASLSAEQKVRQLFNVPLHGEAPEDVARIAAMGVGGVTRFLGPDLTRSMAVARTLADSSTIPLLMSGDIEGGAIAIPFATRLPNQLGLAAAASPDLTEQAVGVLAAEARCLGYNWTFTPVVDINHAFRSAIVATRSYGSDVNTILTHAQRNVRAFQHAGIAATAKHWPGEGYDDRDQHLVTTLNPLNEADWNASFGRIYRSLIDAGVMTIMAGHIALPAYARQHGAQGLEACRPASVSALLNQQLLRGELGFNGLIVSDACGMAGLSSWAERASFAPEVIANGCDMLLFPNTFELDFGHVMRALSDGRLTEERVEHAVTRVLGLKAALGLHRMSPEELVPPLAKAQATIRCHDHLVIETRTAQASVTLVKDVHQLLPLTLQRHRRIVLVTDPNRHGIVFPDLPLHLPSWLSERGFDVRTYDTANPPTSDNCDLVLYLLAQESLLAQSHIYMDWFRLQGGDLRGSMRRHWHEVPCALVSFGHPYYLYDAPRMPCVINAYTAIEPVQRAVLAKLLGEQAFAGISPVDPTCGLPDAMY